MRIKMRCWLLLLCCILLSCESKVQFLIHDEDCHVEIVQGKEVCVQKKIQKFRIGEQKYQSVDFIFVLDVSESMRDDLARIGEAFSPLISHIQDKNWHILFTTTDHGDHSFTKNPITGETKFTQQNWRDYQGDEPHFGKFMPLEYQANILQEKQLSKNIKHYQQIFHDTLARNANHECDLPPFCQGAMEQPLRALKASLERLAENPSMLYSSGDIIAFLVTDEDERMEDLAHAESAQSVAKTAKQLFPDRNFHAFTMLIQDEACLLEQKQFAPDAVYGKQVAALSNLTGGQSISLCEENYDIAFTEISQLLRRLIEQITLKEIPILKHKTKVQFLKGKDVSWEIHGKKLLFDEALQPNSEIKVSYWVLKKDNKEKL